MYQDQQQNKKKRKLNPYLIFNSRIYNTSPKPFHRKGYLMSLIVNAKHHLFKVFS